jgi:hypothetical protein
MHKAQFSPRILYLDTLTSHCMINGDMKKPYAYEAVAIVCGIAGAFVLVSGLMPFINPGFVETNATGDDSPRVAFLVPTLFSLPLLGIRFCSFYFATQDYGKRSIFASNRPHWLHGVPI